MIDLRTLAQLAESQLAFHDLPVAALRLADRVIDTDARPVIQAVVNLSPDSTYRTSIAPDTAAAIRKSRIAVAQGADLVDLGARSTSAGAAAPPPEEQVARLEPVVRALSGEGIVTSVESGDPAVIDHLVQAGSRVINLVDSTNDDAVFAIAAASAATLILCYSPRGQGSAAGALPSAHDGLRAVVDSLRPRVASAIRCGVESIAVDPGIGLTYVNLRDPLTRVEEQSRYLLLGGALRQLGFPVVQSLPNGFTIFQEHYRSGEAYFAVLAMLGRAGALRVHEVGEVRAVREAMRVTIGAMGGGASVERGAGEP